MSDFATARKFGGAKFIVIVNVLSGSKLLFSVDFPSIQVHTVNCTQHEHPRREEKETSRVGHSTAIIYIDCHLPKKGRVDY